MASLTLTKMWLNLFTTGAAVSGYHDPDDADVRESAGRVSTYAGGRQRGVTTEGVAGEWTFNLRQVAVADTVTLQSWIGQTIQVRDNRGRKMFGILLAVPRKPWRESLDTYDCQLTLRMVTVVEDV